MCLFIMHVGITHNVQRIFNFLKNTEEKVKKIPFDIYTTQTIYFYMVKIFWTDFLDCLQ